MEQLRFSELHCREVINLYDGVRMGEVSDLLLDTCTGQITALIVPGKGKILGLLGAAEDIVLPWGCIETLGEDYILVRYRQGCER